MLKSINKYLYIIYTSYKNYTVYSYDILGKIITFGFRIIVIILLYKVLFGVYGYQNGFGIEQATWAVIFAQIIVSSSVAPSEEIDIDIKSGKIQIQLLNPFSYVRFKFLELFPKIMFNITFLSIVGVIIGYSFLGSIDFGILSILAGILMIILSAILNLLGYMIIGLLAFYTEDTEPFRWIYSKSIMIFGGNVLPIQFLPGPMQTFAWRSPFAYVGYVVGMIVVNFDINFFIKSLSIMSGWIIIYFITIKLLYSHAITKLNINGG